MERASRIIASFTLRTAMGWPSSFCGSSAAPTLLLPVRRRVGNTSWASQRLRFVPNVENFADVATCEPRLIAFCEGADEFVIKGKENDLTHGGGPRLARCGGGPFGSARLWGSKRVQATPLRL